MKSIFNDNFLHYTDKLWLWRKQFKEFSQNIRVTIPTLFLNHVKFLVGFCNFLFLFYGNFIILDSMFWRLFLSQFERLLFCLSFSGFTLLLLSFFSGFLWKKAVFDQWWIIDKDNVGRSFALTNERIIIEIKRITEHIDKEIWINVVRIRLIDHFRVLSIVDMKEILVNIYYNLIW